MVHMGDVIEHVFDPVGFLKNASRTLRPGGILLVVTPDIDRFFARLFQLKPREHLVYFNGKSMAIALRRAGFKPVLMESQRRFRDIGNVRRSTTKLNPIFKSIAIVASIPPFGPILKYLAFFLIKDELLAVAKKESV